MKPAEVQRLVESAQAAMQNAVAPYSGFKVGAAIMSRDGNIYRGCNVENPSLMLSICAERAALAAAITDGVRHFEAIAIVSSDGRYCTPCGACRQILAEFAPGASVYLESAEGIKKYSVEELLPHPFKR